MALEEPKDSDLKVSEGGYDFIMEESFSQVYSKFSIGYSENFLRKGFTVRPDRGGSSC